MNRFLRAAIPLGGLAFATCDDDDGASSLDTVVADGAVADGAVADTIDTTETTPAIPMPPDTPAGNHLGWVLGQLAVDAVDVDASTIGALFAPTLIRAFGGALGVNFALR
ncbi:MAG: hypothetical protein ACI9MR_000932 [Myxococcota bacterium]|jgi:hypothetical protein